MAWGPEEREDTEPEALGLETRGWVKQDSNGGSEGPRLTKNARFKESCTVYLLLSEQAGCSDNDLGMDLFGL